MTQSASKFLLAGFLFGCAIPLFSQNFPSAIRLDPAAHILYTGDQASEGLYDESTLRIFELWFDQTNYWQQLTTNYSTKTDLPATLIVEGDTFPNVGVRFKGQTSYSMAQNSQKKSFNITLDYADPEQNLMGYETINLNNAFEDASFMREVSYLHQIRKHVPAAKANYVQLFINGVNWGIYPNVQQLNRDYIKEWFYDNDGTLWRADRPGGTGGPGGPGWGDGTGGLNNLGADTTTYKQYYTLKSTDDSTAWDELVRVCQKLNTTPAAQLEDTISKYMDLDRTLWFLASEIAFSDDDSYVFKGKMDYYIYYDPETGFLTPLEFDGNSVMKSNATNWSAFYNETKVNYPLLNKLLAVPSIRQRYLAHMRTLVQEEMNTTAFNALVDQYDALINAGVQADTKKLYSYNEYTTQKTAIKNFIQTHRNTLLNHAEMGAVGPVISAVSMKNAAGDTWGAPAENESAVMLATFNSTTDLAAVHVYYSGALAGRFSKVQMFDDGAHDDGNAGDGVYGADIPGFATGTYVRFYVEAKSTNTAGTVTYSPVGAEHNVYYYRVVAPWATERPVVINEIMASNATTAEDENDQYEDWIELYNLMDIPVNLSGYSLSDNPSNLQKWTFPEGTLIPEFGYMIVWADEDSAQGPFHANFKLSASGESLMLSDALGRMVDTLNWGQQVTDKGYARVPNGTGSFVIQEPTFGANNGTVAAHEAPSLAAWSLTPSLVKDALRIELFEATSGTLQLLDLQGKLLMSKKISNNDRINVSELPVGTYAARMILDGHSSVRLFVKQ